MAKFLLGTDEAEARSLEAVAFTNLKGWNGHHHFNVDSEPINITNRHRF
jgi:hypothetical protein